MVQSCQLEGQEIYTSLSTKLSFHFEDERKEVNKTSSKIFHVDESLQL